MPDSIKFSLYKNIPNIVSILGVLPLIALFTEEGYEYLIPLIIYNNIMDDLDGILAGKLNIRSAFGARLDNVCDAISHTIIVMAVGMHYGWVCGLVGLIGISAILIRSGRRAIRRGDTAAGLNYPVLAYNHPITIDQEYRPGGCQTTIDGGDIIPRHPVLHCPEPFWKFTE